MNRSITNHSLASREDIAARILCAGVAVFFVAVPVRAQDWTRNFRVGMSAGINLRADFEIGEGNFPVTGGQPGVYSDGYVLPDATGNAGGQTWNWGYENADQFNPDTRMLSFQSPESFSTAGGSREVEDGPHLGLDVAYGGTLVRWKKAIVGWELGFQWLPINIQDSRPFPATITTGRDSVPVPDGEVLPEPGYEGTFDGPGPLIGADPVDGGTTTSPGMVGGRRELDATLYNFRLGPTLHWELHRYVAVSVSGGFSMGIVSGDYNYREDVQLSDGSSLTSRGSFGTTDVVYGGYVGGVLLVHVQQDADIYMGAHFISMSDFSLSQGGRGVSLDLSQGIFFSAGISWPF